MQGGSRKGILIPLHHELDTSTTPCRPSGEPSGCWFSNMFWAHPSPHALTLSHAHTFVVMHVDSAADRWRPVQSAFAYPVLLLQFNSAFALTAKGHPLSNKAVNIGCDLTICTCQLPYRLPAFKEPISSCCRRPAVWAIPFVCQRR